MGDKEEFAKAWRTRFDRPPPLLACLEADASGNLEVGHISRTYSECQDKIKDLQEQLDQQNFMSTFLWDLAHSNRPSLGGIKPSTSFGKSLKIKGMPSETDLDTLVLADDEDKRREASPENLFYSYATLPDCDDSRQRNHCRPPPEIPTEAAPKRTSQTGPTLFEANSGQQNTDSHLKLGPGRERLKTLEPPPTKDKPKFVGGSFKKSGPVKSNSFDSGNSLKRTGSDCHQGVPGDRSSTASIGKPKPVPAPRPSVKGPSASRNSTISECNVAVVAPYKSEATGGEAPHDKTPPVVPLRQESMESSSHPQEDGAASHGARAKNFKGPMGSGRMRVRQHAYEDIDIGGAEESGAGKVTLGSQNGTSTSQPPAAPAAAPLASFKPVRVAPAAPVVPASFSTFGKSSAGATPSPQIKDNTPLSLTGSGAAGGEAIYAVPHEKPPESSSNKALERQESENVEYSEALHVERIESVDDEDSSSDEEPVYYNLLLMKQNTLNRASIDTMGNTDGQRRNVEQKARRLSQRFSKSIDPSLLANVGKSRLDRVGEDPTTQDGSASLKEATISENTPVEDAVWKKRHSMALATEVAETASISSACSDDNELDMSVPFHSGSSSQVRKFVVSGILESEKNYVDILDILLQYMQTFKNVLSTPQTVISDEDIKVIFNKIPILHKIHYQFIHDMEPIMENWKEDASIAEPFKLLALEECQVASDYLKNYHKAVSTVERCKQESPRFAELTSQITCKGFTDKPGLDELLHKPVVRFQRNTLVLHDLIKCTPTTHRDYDLLQKTLKITTNFLDSFTNPKEKDSHESQRYLSKQGLLVEEVGTSKPQRKLRHVFLFNDVLICAKQKLRPQKITYEVKWHVPLIDLILENKKCNIDEKKSAEVEELQHRVSELQAELKAEMRKARTAQEGQVGVINTFQRSWSFRGHARNLEKVKKKLLETEAQLLIWSPHLGFRLKSKRHPKGFTLLMASDYERMAWQDLINGLKTKVQQSNFAGVDWNQLINSQKQPKVPSLNAMLEKEDFGLTEEDTLSGALTVTIHRLNGLKTPSNTYCCVEVDSFGHFFLKARTNVQVATTEPCWDEAFDLDLEGSQTVRLLCYKEALADDQPVLVGKCALELSKAWLRGDFKESPVSLNNEVSIVLSLRYSSREQTLKRAPSAISGGLFGVKLSKVTKRECSSIPVLVTTCVQEIERRGIKETGIYRISGLSAEIQKMRKAFEKSSRGAAQHAKTTDVNVLTGLLKLYFRELPEALFTDKLYPSLVDVMGMADPENKEKLMLNLVRSLPEPNHSTVVYILEHLVLISHHELHNKMSLHNIATVFGPTLLRPAIKIDEPQSMEAMFSAGARDAMMQTGILLFLLNLKAKGGDFDRVGRRQNFLAVPEEP